MCNKTDLPFCVCSLAMWKESVTLSLVSYLVTYSLAHSFHEDQLETDEIIEAVNNANTTWQVIYQKHNKHCSRNIFELRETNT